MLHDAYVSSHPTEHAGGWTVVRIETLKSLWSEGKSASEIATALGAGVTRSAVIGKVHRLKLPARSNPVRAERPSGSRGNAGKDRGLVDAVRKARSKAQPKAAAINHRLATLVPVRAVPVPNDLPEWSARRRLLDLGSDDCRYCNGDPLTADHSFCGEPVRPGTSWCEAHYSIVFPPRS